MAVFTFRIVFIGKESQMSSLPIIIPRTIEETFKQWKKQKRKKPLLFCDNSSAKLASTISEFGEQNFKETVSINLKNASHHFIHLDDDSNVIDKFQSISGRGINREESLVVLSGLKDPDIVSKIAVILNSYHRKYSVIIIIDKFDLLTEFIDNEQLQVLVLDIVGFMDFLRIINSQKVVATMNHFTKKEEYLKPIKPAFYNHVMDKFIQHVIVGNNPIAINSYQENKDLSLNQTLQSNLIADMRLKILEQNQDVESLRMNFVLSLHKQYQSNYKKFKFHAIKPTARYREYKEAIKRLVTQGYLIRVDSVEGSFKLFFKDPAILINQMRLDYLRMIVNRQIPPSVMETYIVNSLKSIPDYNLNYVLTKSKNITPYILSHNLDNESYGIFIGGGYPKRFIKNIMSIHSLNMAIKIGNHNVNYCDKDRILSLPIFMTDHIFDFIKKAKIHGSYMPEFRKKYSLY